MDEELEMDEEQKDEIIEESVASEGAAITTTVTDGVLPLAPDSYESPFAASDEPSSYLGDEESTTLVSDDEESSEDKLGSCDCRSECKYNTGDRSKYANYGYSD